MDPPRESTDDRYAHVMRELNNVMTVGALTIYALTALSVLGSSRSLVWVLGCVLALMPINWWITAVMLKTRGALVAESARQALNICACLVLNHATGWPLAGWLWLPFVGIAFDGFKRNVTWAGLTITCVAVDGLALRDGVAWIYPLTFTALAYFCRIATETRVSIVRDMFQRSEVQRQALDDAHASLTSAHDRLTAAVEARKRAELELRQSQKLEAVGRLASGVAHEINTPLQFVTNSAQFIGEGVSDLLRYLEHAPRNEGALPEDVDLEYLRSNLPDAVQMAIDGLGRVSAIVSSLKEFAHPEQTEPIDLDLNHAIETTLTVARHEYRYVADVRTDLCPVPPVRCHAGEINQVLLNLVVNASHAISESGRHGPSAGVITIKTARDGDDVVVTVSDNGAGIPEAIQNKIFEPFFTTKPVGRGTGQGLAIARSIVEGKHGGKLGFKSKVGSGTTFTMRLPINREGSTARTKDAA